MRKIIAVILTLCLVLTAFPLIVSADSPGPAALQKKVYFADCSGQFSSAYLFGWEMQGDYSFDVPYDWPGIMMEEIEHNENGDAMFAAVMPQNINRIIIHDGNGHQTVEIPLNERVLITLTGEIDETLYYKVNVEDIPDNVSYPTLPDDGTTQPTVPTEPNNVEDNLIVLDNAAGTFADDIYICCRTGEVKGEESTIRAKTERFGFNDYGEGMYRFSMPEGMKYYYFTDGKIRSKEYPFDGSAHRYISGDKDADGNLNLVDADWCGGIDPAFTQGPSHTLFDRFCDDYVIPLYDGWPAEVGFTDLYQLYDEVYEHHDNTGGIDWILLRAESFGQLTYSYKVVIGNRIVTRSAVGAPFDSGYGVYDAAQARFVPLNGKNTAEYDGLSNAFDTYGSGSLLGDLDGDDSLTVIDATILQRCEAKMRDYPAGDEMAEPLGTIRYYSDFNRDGERDITDATCIQRYLAGQTYPIG